jgi:hypothetical protein
MSRAPLSSAAVLLTCLLSSVCLPGCNLLSAFPDRSDADEKSDPAPGPGPAPAPSPKFAEQEYWEALARLVESGRFRNTDQIWLTAQAEKELGNLKDLSRISEFETKRFEVKTDDRKSIADKIRGK